MNWQVTHLRVNDAATGRPTPVRLRLTGPDGSPLAPLGRLAQLSSPSAHVPGHLWLDDGLWTYIDGACEVRLPAGTLHLQATKGPGYVPASLTLERRTGQIALRCELQPRSSLRKQGWFSGDCFVEGLSPAAAWLEGAAEGLDLVHVAASTEPELLDFSAQEPAWARDGTLVAVGTWNGRLAAQSLVLMHTHRIVFPLRQTDPGFEHYTLADWAHQAHRKRGFVAWPFQPPDAEVLATLLCGEVDAVGLLPDTDVNAALHLTYRLWDAGLPIRLVAGSGKRDVSRPVGLWRTWVRLPKESPLTFSAWIEALRHFGSTVSRGPWLTLEVNGTANGTVDLSEDGLGTPRTVMASATELNPGDYLELVADGQVLERVWSREGQAHLSCHESARVVGWWAARCCDQSGALLAHTSAVRAPTKQAGASAQAAWLQLRSALDELARKLTGDRARVLRPLLQEALAAKPEHAK